MRKNKKNNQSNPDPYEDYLRIDELDPYEALIKVNLRLKQNNKSLE